MRIFLVVCLQLLLGTIVAGASEVNMRINGADLKPINTNFDQHTYISLPLPLGPLQNAFKEAQKHARRPLKTRGEAHLTVVTPLEYQRLSAKDRDVILTQLEKMDWDREQIHPICLARAQLMLQGRPELTYFVVVVASEIEAIRKQAGLTDFEPHITVGFTKRDLHREDGVRKDDTACLK